MFEPSLFVVRSVQCNIDGSMVATVGLDRRLRVHSVNTRFLRGDVYLKQRLTCVLFGESSKPHLKRKAAAAGDDESNDSDDEADSSGADTDSLFDALERAEEVSVEGDEVASDDFSVDDSDSDDSDGSGDSDASDSSAESVDTPPPAQRRKK